MGVKGLWELLEGMYSVETLAEFGLRNGFMANFQTSRSLHVGVDAPGILVGFRAADLALGQLHSSNTTITQLQKFLCQLGQSFADCTFVFDGDERQSIKRGHQVVTREPDFFNLAKELIQLFGYRVLVAKGDAEAELAYLNREGKIDVIISKDSDVFPFGAQCVLRLKPENSTDRTLAIQAYNSEDIQRHLGISWAGFVLIALILPSDFGTGVPGIGPTTALALAQCQFGERLVQIYNNNYTMPNVLETLFQGLNEEMSQEIRSNAHQKLSQCSPIMADILRSSKFPSLRNVRTLKAFLMPQIHHPPAVSRPLSWMPDVDGIRAFTEVHFRWDAHKILNKFRISLWPAVVIRMLQSKYLVYDAAHGRLTLENPLEYNDEGYLRCLTALFLTSIKGHNPPCLKGKKLGEYLPITFSTDALIKLASLSPSAKKNQRIKLHIPVEVIAAATNQIKSINGLAALLNTNTTVGDESTPEHKGHEVIDLTDDECDENSIHTTQVVLDNTTVGDESTPEHKGHEVIDLTNDECDENSIHTTRVVLDLTQELESDR